jgi:hypothetical protein
MSLACLLLLAAFTAVAGEFEDAPASANVLIERARGAWFRKVVGPRGEKFDGIEGWGVLPTPSFDPAREHSAAPGEEAYKTGPLDRPDVYLGLSAEGAEVDAGLIWDHVYDLQGRDTGAFAYRVYWRTSKGGWQNPAVGAADNIYLRPGDRFALTLRARPGGR